MIFIVTFVIHFDNFPDERRNHAVFDDKDKAIEIASYIKQKYPHYTVGIETHTLNNPKNPCFYFYENIEDILAGKKIHKVSYKIG
jgi:hypothetical protein